MRKTTTEAAQSVRAKAGEVYAAARETARDGARAAKDRAETTVEDNPLAALIGAAAIGLLAGALLPATRHETGALGPLSRTIGGGAKSVLAVARDTGHDALITLGVNEAAARLRVDELLDAAATALSAALDAAADAMSGAAPDDAPR
jgi:hypothetical protein